MDGFGFGLDRFQKRFFMNIEENSIQTLSSLKKKPSPDTWTTLATIILSENNHFTCVALGTGTKTIPTTSQFVVSDCHAEVICKRSFTRYLYTQINLHQQNLDSIFAIAKDTGKLKLKPGIQFHMYISQAMCGDASMSYLIDSQTAETNETFEILKKKQKLVHSYTTNFRDGIILRGRSDFNSLGKLRTKPGRIDSEPTFNMSCTDKLLKWCKLGLQGSLLDLLIHPIFPTSLIVASGWTEKDQERFQSRLNLINSNLIIHDLKSDLFEFSRNNASSRDPLSKPSDQSICWFKNGSVQVLVQGRKQGFNSKALEKAKSYLCRADIFETFKNITDSTYSNLDYHQVKLQSTDYIKKRNEFYILVGGWIQKSN